jgi:SP family sugar:H+ symporter-like MFS transporter
MAFQRFQKGSGGQTPQRPEGPSTAAIVAEQKVTVLAIFLGAVASIGGFMFGYVR